MATEKRTGVGGALAGVLERATPPRTEAEPVNTGDDSPETSEAEATPKGRGAGRKAGPRAAREKPRARTVYLDDALFERVLVQAHRRRLTISEYVAGVLARNVPDHRARQADDDAA